MVSGSISSVLSSAVSFCALLSSGARVGVVGSRGFAQLSLVSEFVAALPAGCVVVSGAARGVDREAAVTARAAGLEVVEFPASWGSLGRSAGMQRNAQIVGSVSVLVAFWDGVSRGTASSVEMARRSGVPVFVVSPPPPPGSLVQASLF